MPAGRAAASHEFSGAPNQVMRGSRRNHTRWRRAKRPGAADRGVQGRVQVGLVAVQVRRGSPCTRWPGGRCATSPGGRRRGARTSSTSPASPHRRRTAARSGRAGSARGIHTPAICTGNTVGAVLAEAGTERRERLPGELDHLERADDAARVRRLDPRRRDRVRALELAVRGGEPVGLASTRAVISARSARSSPGKRRSSTTACT